MFNSRRASIGGLHALGCTVVFVSTALRCYRMVDEVLCVRTIEETVAFSRNVSYWPRINDPAPPRRSGTVETQIVLTRSFLFTVGRDGEGMR